MNEIDYDPTLTPEEVYNLIRNDEMYYMTFAEWFEGQLKKVYNNGVSAAGGEVSWRNML